MVDIEMGDIWRDFGMGFFEVDVFDVWDVMDVRQQAWKELS
jgi:hypothetical protein